MTGNGGKDRKIKDRRRWGLFGVRGIHGGPVLPREYEHVRERERKVVIKGESNLSRRERVMSGKKGLKKKKSAGPKGGDMKKAACWNVPINKFPYERRNKKSGGV